MNIETVAGRIEALNDLATRVDDSQLDIFSAFAELIKIVRAEIEDSAPSL